MRTRLTLAGAATALLVAGCGGSSAPSTATLERSDGPAPTESSSAAAAPTASSAPEPGGSSASTGAAVPAASAGTGGGGTAPQAVAAAPSAKADTDATAPGRYTYDASGTVNAGSAQHVDSTPTLTVDPPAGDRQHSVLKSDQGTTDQVLVVRPTGTYLVRLKLTTPGVTKEFAPATPVLLVPDPATVGRSWSWTATSTDGKTTIAFTGRITRTESVTIGGAAVPTSVVESTTRLSGDITYTMQTESWYDAAHRLRVKEHVKGNGRYGGFAVTTDITSVLRSTKPS